MALVLLLFSSQGRQSLTSLEEAKQEVHHAAAQHVAKSTKSVSSNAGASKLADDTAKNLAVASAIKKKVGSASEEGGDLLKKRFGIDPKEIAKVQQEAKAAADEEIDSAVASAKDAAATSYQDTRDRFLHLESNLPSGASDASVGESVDSVIYPKEGTDWRPVGYVASPHVQGKQQLAQTPPTAAPQRKVTVGNGGDQHASIRALLEQAVALQRESSDSKEAAAELAALRGKLHMAYEAMDKSLSSAEQLEAGDVQTDGAEGDKDDAEANRLYKEAIADLLKRLENDIDIVGGSSSEPPAPTVPKSDASPPKTADSPPKTAGATSSSGAGAQPTRLDLTAPVDTECGRIKGIIHNGVRVFKGIPYALPPTGPRRWGMPVASNAAVEGVPMGGCWDGTLEATTFGAVCPQAEDPFFAPKETQDESCLFLNVYAPIDEQAEGLPVVVFVHGGGNIAGAGSRYDASGVARRGMVVVTLNFRVGALGFLALSSLSATSESKASGNYGVADIAMGLKWVKANIQGFGGDPSAITLMGHGAGGTNVLALSVSPFGKEGGEPLFQRILALSPDPRFDTALPTAQDHNTPFVDSAGCANADPAVEAKCLRALSVQDVLLHSPMTSPPFWDPRAAPDVNQFDLPTAGQRRDGLVMVDGHVVPAASWRALQDPAAIAPVPFMVTVMAQESDAEPPAAPNSATEFEDAVTKRLHSFGEFWEAPRGEVSFAAEALRLYPLSEYASPIEAYESMVTDLRMLCPLKRLMGLAASATTMPVYLGVNTVRLQGEVSVNSLSSDGFSAAVRSAEASSLSAHALDLVLFFQDETHLQLSGADLEAAAGLQGVFDHFVRTGTTEGANHLAIPSATAYAWKPVADSAGFEVTDSLNFPTNVDVAVIKGRNFHVTMEAAYRSRQCGLWSRDAIDRTYAAAA